MAELPTIFPVPWNEVQLHHVQDFLADAGDEGLTWEAKGESDGPTTTRKVGKEVCAFANSVGGYLILGAEGGQGEPWSLPGLTVPDPEPKAWASRVIVDRLRPVPSFDVHSWRADSGKQVILIAVQPAALPPCLTVDGLAYERVTSQTIKIDDPTVLSRLIQRGDSARMASEVKARAAANLINTAEPLGDYDPTTVTRLTLGVAATGYAPDIGSRLFSQRFMTNLGEVAISLARETDMNADIVNPEWVPSHTQSRVRMALSLSKPNMPTDQRFGVVAAWDGSVSTTWETTTRDISIDSAVEPYCRLAWRVNGELVRALGGYGEAHFALQVTAAAGAAGHGYLATMGTPLERKVDIDNLTSLDLGGVARELRRASGMIAYEPEASTGTGES